MSEEIVDQEEVFEEEEQEEETSEPEADSQEESTEEVDWEARAKKAEALIVKNKQKPKQPIKTDSKEDEVPEWGRDLLSEREKRTFQSENGLTSDTVDAVFRANGGKMPTDEQMESDDLLKTVVRSYQSKARVASNTPKGGGYPVYKGKSFAEVAQDPDASKEDKQAAFEARKKQLTKK